MLVHKPPFKHLEVYNDLNDDLVRFWMAARDQPEALQQRIDSLPYSCSLYHSYRASLRVKEPMDDLERAARWFYLLRSTFGGVPDFSKGWGYTLGAGGQNRARSLRTATALLPLVVERFRSVQIEHQDFATIINATPALVALSYYEHPLVDDLYSATRWRRLTWTQAKAVQKTRDSRAEKSC